MTTATQAMKAQAGTRFIGSYTKTNEHGRSRVSSHFSGFDEFSRRIMQDVDAYEISEPVFDDKPCMDKLSKYLNCK